MGLFFLIIIIINNEVISFSVYFLEVEKSKSMNILGFLISSTTLFYRNMIIKLTIIAAAADEWTNFTKPTTNIYQGPMMN